MCGIFGGKVPTADASKLSKSFPHLSLHYTSFLFFLHYTFGHTLSLALIWDMPFPLPHSGTRLLPRLALGRAFFLALLSVIFPSLLCLFLFSFLLTAPILSQVHRRSPLAHRHRGLSPFFSRHHAPLLTNVRRMPHPHGSFYLVFRCLMTLIRLLPFSHMHIPFVCPPLLCVAVVALPHRHTLPHRNALPFAALPCCVALRRVAISLRPLPPCLAPSPCPIVLCPGTVACSLPPFSQDATQCCLPIAFLHMRGHVLPRLRYVAICFCSVLGHCC